MFDPKQVSVADIAQMFEGTIVTYDKKPVYVMTPDEKKNLRFIGVGLRGDENVVTRHISDKAWDFRPVQLGACQVGNNTAWLYRTPLRQYKQGTCIRNVGFKVVSEVRELPRSEHLLLNSFNFKELEDCILGNYLSFEKVIKQFDSKEDLQSSPLSRDFSVTRELELWFRDMKVGMINEENGKAMFKRGSKFLSSLFEGVENVA